MRRIDATNLAAVMAETRRQLEREVADITDAKGPVMRQAGRTLVKGIRRQVATRGTESAPSAPGSPPHRISGKLWRSFATGVVEGVRRVGSGYYVARLAEKGSDKQQPRPYMRRGFEATEAELGEVIVSQAQARVRRSGP